MLFRKKHWQKTLFFNKKKRYQKKLFMLLTKAVAKLKIEKDKLHAYKNINGFLL